MKHLLLALVLTLVAGEAHAINRYTSTSMSCERIQATIAREGAAIMRYKSLRSGVPLYGRFVTWREECGNRMLPQRTFIPSSDTPKCPVLECQRFDPDDALIFFR
ncbi:MAG: hypothetical protein KF914_20655 [Rhizobiaceae bacterium]|nr:hypothetical protein [Rhizobiaceae bacterium]